MKRLFACLVVLFALAACDEDAAITDARERAATEGRETGRAEGYARGYEDGVRRGRTDGLAQGRSEGRALGRSEAVGTWTPIGFGSGLLLGLGVVLVVARGPLGRSIAERRRVARLRRWLGAAPPRVDAMLTERLEALGQRRLAVDAAIAEARSDVVRALADDLAPRMDALGARIMRTAERLHRHRVALADLELDPQQIEDRIAALEADDEPEGRRARAELIAGERARLDAWRRARRGAERGEMELSATEAHLDRLRMDILALDARADSDAPDAIGPLRAEIDALSRSLTEIDDG